MLPTFLIIGAAKSGTSSLFEYVRGHPDVYMPDQKELHFFGEEFNWHKGIDWYRAWFEDAADAQAVGEASTTYTRFPYSQGVPQRVAETLPKARLIYIMRHPVERAISQCRYHIWDGWEKERNLETALRCNPFYVDTSCYAMQIAQYLEHFPLDSMLLIPSEDLKNQRESTMKKIFGFIGVSPDWSVPNVETEFNPTDEKRLPRSLDRVIRSIPLYETIATHTPIRLKRVKYRAMTKPMGATPSISLELRRELEESLRPDVKRLQQFMSSGFDGWGLLS